MTSIKKIDNIKVIIGNFPVKSNISYIFHKQIIQFFDYISKKIINTKEFKKYPDLFQFGFWCRKSNIIKLSQDYLSKKMVVGRGIVFHLPPSNVPMNFAYSLAFGMLSGNTNIVRLPSKNFNQIQIFCKIVKEIIKKKNLSTIRKKIIFIRYDRSEKISAYLSKNVDARLIWGGDNTVEKFKTYETKKKCVDLNFPNRYSTSVINVNALSKLNKFNFDQIIKRFYSDCYTMDQNGCSSPQSIIWVGKDTDKIINKFWNALNKIVDKEYSHDLPVTNNKIFTLSNLVLKNKNNLNFNIKNFKITRIKSKKIPFELENINCNFGTFFEIRINKIEELKNIITEKFQTVTTYGIKKNRIKKLILNNNLKGIDRIVSIGSAFNMSEKWDGYDTIHFLSRIINDA